MSITQAILRIFVSSPAVDLPEHRREALDRALRPECGYPWGEAESLYVCGLAHRALGEPEHGLRRFREAEVRERIEQPGLAETRRLLKEL